MRKLVYFVATSLDGYIAQDDGVLSGFIWDDNYGAQLLERYPETFPVHIRGDGFSREDNRSFDTILMGRKTYEIGVREGVTSPYPTLDQYVFSKSIRDSPDKDVHLVSENAIDVVRTLKQQDGRDIWLCGGAELGTQLMSASLIDKIVVKLNPVVFGSGIPMFYHLGEPTGMLLRDHKVFGSGHMILQYDIR